MGNYATRTSGTIGLCRGDIVKVKFPGGKEQLAVVMQGVQVWSKTTTVVVTPLEKVSGNRGNSKVIHVGKDRYTIQADKSRVCSKLRLRIAEGYMTIEGHVSKREMAIVDNGFAFGTLLEARGPWQPKRTESWGRVLGGAIRCGK